MRARGFTLIEVVVTVAIVGLLATLVSPLAELGIRRGKEGQLRDALQDIREGLDAYKLSTVEGHILMELGMSGYPETLELLVDGVVDAQGSGWKDDLFPAQTPARPVLSSTHLRASCRNVGASILRKRP